LFNIRYSQLVMSGFSDVVLAEQKMSVIGRSLLAGIPRIS
jgi:hypothetical protein